MRHLRPRQVYYQFLRYLVPARLAMIAPVPPRVSSLQLAPWPSRPKTYLGGGRFQFLNREHDCGWPIDWEARGGSHLWQYNLHYFDYLHQPGLDFGDGLSLIRSWIQGHRVSPRAVGWEPYPLSLRLVNWIKFFSGKADISVDLLKSLSLQAVNIRRQLEYQFKGNHLFANGKALWFAGVFLQDEAMARLGRKIILGELEEQFLPDGGHFELSPMYHAIVLEHVLDLINLCRSGGKGGDEEALMRLRAMAKKALGWLAAIIDEQGEIPLLNDSVYEGAPRYDNLLTYAVKLGVQPSREHITKVVLGSWQGSQLSGYWLLSNGPLRLLFDTAPLGPDYLPAHAHCDMLSVLLDFQGKKIFTDTGVYEYQEGQRRSYSRGTSAHNTVILDGHEQAELWKSFRMGRRGYPQGFRQEGHAFSCGHTGFALWKPGLLHERKVVLFRQGFELTDHVSGPQSHCFQAFLHCAPDVRLEARRDGRLIIDDCLLLESWGAELEITNSDYYPQFGVVEKRPCLVMKGNFSRHGKFGLRCTYSF
jgi:uncharacterized heparinase superfamily protein